MFGYCLRGILLLFVSALLLFLTGFAGWRFGLVGLAAGLYALANKAILLAFLLMLLLQTSLMLLAFYRGLSQYFRPEAVAWRRVAMLQKRYRDASQLFLLERRQAYYMAELKRQRLLSANDKKHSIELFKAIDAELKKHVTPGEYKSVRKELKHYRKRADLQAMLALREQMLCQSSIVG